MDILHYLFYQMSPPYYPLYCLGEQKDNKSSMQRELVTIRYCRHPPPNTAVKKWKYWKTEVIYITKNKHNWDIFGTYSGGGGQRRDSMAWVGGVGEGDCIPLLLISLIIYFRMLNI